VYFVICRIVDLLLVVEWARDHHAFFELSKEERLYLNDQNQQSPQKEMFHLLLGGSC
jgi:hypothetical protein